MASPKIRELVLNGLSEMSGRKKFGSEDDEEGGEEGEVKKPHVSGMEVEISAMGKPGLSKKAMETDEQEADNDEEAARADIDKAEDEEDSDDRYRELRNKVPGLTPDMIDNLMKSVRETMLAGKEKSEFEPMDVGMLGMGSGRSMGKAVEQSMDDKKRKRY